MAEERRENISLVIDEIANDIKLEASKFNNAGKIKLNWTPAARPSVVGVSSGTPSDLVLNSNYTVSSSTSYPRLANVVLGGENLIHPSTFYVRELLDKQSIILRIKIGYTGKAQNQTGSIILNISNPNPASTFSENLSIPALSGRTAYEQTLSILIIADSISLDPLYGYRFSVETSFSDNNLNIYINNLTVEYLATEHITPVI